MSEEQKQETGKPNTDFKEDAEGQYTYRYYCRRCGREWYSKWSNGSDCPNCGCSGTRR